MSDKVLLQADGIQNKIRRIASEILEDYPEGDVALVGIHTRGVVVANRVEQALRQFNPDIRLQTGSIDISLYRDDLDNLGTIPSIKGSDLDFPVDKTPVILFDDVLFTGRTVRAAIDCLMDYGRPPRIRLAVLVDRGNRELPVAADYAGHHLDTTREQHISVKFDETDGTEGVMLL